MSGGDPSRTALYLIDSVLDELPEDTPVYHMDLHKLLFLLQERLDDDNAVAEQLPFHWYRHGPVTQAVYDATNMAERAGVARVEEDGGDRLFAPGPQSPPEPQVPSAEEQDLESAESELTEILDEYPFYRSRDTVLEETIYTEAPYQFQTEFKFYGLPAARRFASGEESGTELRRNLLAAESKLPRDEAFENFNRSFSRYVSLVDLLIEAEGDDSEHTLLRAQVQDLAEQAWRVFAHRLRCETADGHHPDELDSWEEQASQSLVPFQESLREFRGDLRTTALNGRESTPVDEDEPWAEVAASILTRS